MQIAPPFVAIASGNSLTSTTRGADNSDVQPSSVIVKRYGEIALASFAGIVNVLPLGKSVIPTPFVQL